MKNVVAIRLTVVLALLLFAVAVWGDAFSLQSEQRFLEVRFLDVGQGDATFIESPSGLQVLIDGGKDRSVLSGLGAAMGFWDRSINVLIATHPDADHVGGLAEVLQRYQVGMIVLTENESDSPAATSFMKAVAVEGAEVVYARAGQVLDLGDGVELSILFPDRGVDGLESNTSSIVTQLSYGQVQLMLTGDAPKSIESYLVDRFGDLLQSEVLKVGHHGSKTSTAEVFVDAVAPEYAVVSAACDSRYGHPHDVVLETLREIEVLGTCEEGTIVFETDGTHVWRSE